MNNEETQKIIKEAFKVLDQPQTISQTFVNQPPPPPFQNSPSSSSSDNEDGSGALKRILVTILAVTSLLISLQLLIYLSSSIFSFFLYQSNFLGVHPYFIGAIELPFLFVISYFLIFLLLMAFFGRNIGFWEGIREAVSDDKQN